MQTPEPLESILVATDADGLAANAVIRGWTLADRLGARLDLIHAVEAVPPQVEGISRSQHAAMFAGILTGAREKVIESLRRAIQERSIRLAVDDSLRIHPGHAAKVIRDKASELGSDLILLGPHAKRSLFDFGSTARALLSNVAAPIWIQAEPVRAIESILVPIDLSPNSRRSFAYAHGLAAQLGASLRVVHCYTPPDFAYGNSLGVDTAPTYVVDQERSRSKEEFERWMSDFEWGSVPGDSSFVEGNATTRILSEAEHADLVVMGTHGRTGLSRFLLGSVAYSVLKRSTTPVVVISGRERAWLLEEEREEQSPGETSDATTRETDPSLRS